MTVANTLTIDAFMIDTKPFPSELKKDSRVEKTFHKNYHGDASHLGWLDLVQLRKTIKQNHITHIVLKSLDILGKIGLETKEIQMCTSYIYNSHILTTLPEHINPKHCTPCFRTVVCGGWDFTNDDDELPYRAEYYMQTLLIQTKVLSVTYQTNKVKVTVSWGDNGHPIVTRETI